MGSLRILHLLFIVSAFLIAGRIGAGAAFAGNLPTVSMAYYEDLTGSETLASVAEKTLTAFDGDLRPGFGTGAIWIRLLISAPPPHTNRAGDPLIVRITPTFLDHVAVFQTCDGRVIEQNLGDQYPASNRAYPALSLNLQLLACASSQPVWVRVQSTSTRNISVQIAPLDELIFLESVALLESIGAVALIFVLFVIILVLQHDRTERLFIAFSLQQISILTFIFSFSGLERMLVGLPPMLGDRLGSVLVVFSVFTIILFNYEFLKLYNPSLMMRRLAFALGACTLINLIFVFTDLRQMALQSNVILFLAAGLFFLIMAALIDRAHDDHYPLAKNFTVLYYSALIAIFLLSGFSVLGVYHVVAGNVAIQYSLFSTVVMSAILIRRSKRITQSRREKEVAFAINQNKIFQLERFRRQQEQLLTMLVHETKTPIAVLKFALENASTIDEARPKISTQLNVVTQIIDRCKQAYTVEDPDFRTQVTDIAFGAFLHHVTSGRPIRMRVHRDAPELIQADEQLLEIVLSNLLDNAVRYSHKEHRPSVWCRPVEKDGRRGLVVTVANRPGEAGFPDASQVFQKYYRSNAARNISGSGLGLFLARRIALMLDGTLEYMPKGQCVRFCLWLPL